MSLQSYYYNLGKLTKQSSARSLILPTAVGGLGGLAYGMTRKENPTKDPLHPASATYGAIGLKAGLGTGAAALATKLLGIRGSNRAGLAVLGGLGGGIYGLHQATEQGRPDLLLKQPGLDYSDNDYAYNLASLKGVQPQ
jgi:hypothetical protein